MLLLLLLLLLLCSSITLHVNSIKNVSVQYFPIFAIVQLTFQIIRKFTTKGLLPEYCFIILLADY